jgi:penicillin-binding protein 1A
MPVLRVIKRLTSLGLVLISVSLVFTATIVTIAPQIGEIATSTSSVSAEIELQELTERSAMYAADGSFLTFLVDENRQNVELEDIPQEVVMSVLAVEDFDFYQHSGINYRAVFRAALANVNSGSIEGGGSTITQQLVKMNLLSSDQNLGRKIPEAFLARRLETEYTKDELLQRYLNSVYFGSNAYGVQAAAETYFGKDIKDLGWEEGAMLAGIISRPGAYDPTVNADRARDRRFVVADRLLAVELIDEEMAESIKRAPLPAERRVPRSIKPNDYYVQEALEALLDDPDIPLGDDRQSRFNKIYYGGLKIHLFLDPAAQAAALQARDDILPDDPRGFTSAMAAVDTHTSAVVAMVGGPEFAREQFNIATQGLRQPGSSMKTFVLAAAFEAGYTSKDTIRGDSPCEFKNPGGVPDPYKVKGGTKSYAFQSLASVTRASNNCAFVRLGQVVNNENVVEVASRLGISTPLEAVLSLPLGSKEVYALEMAAAYAAFGNDGIYNEPSYISHIEDANGTIIYENRPDSRRSVSVQTARMITETLESNVRAGTGTKARVDGGHPAAGKTGTAQNNEDAWFVGYTDYITTAVWMGHPDEKVPMRNVRGWGNMFGGKVPAYIFAQFNSEYHADLEPVAFADPEPYGGGKRLKVAGEIDFCSGSPREAPEGTERVDTDGDGKTDCFRALTTTTESTTTTTTAPPPIDPDAPTTTAAAPPPNPAIRPTVRVGPPVSSSGPPSTGAGNDG